MNAATFVKLISLGATSSKENSIQCYIFLVNGLKLKVSAQR
jgi:sRNA-binding regulator protein Hfq